MSNSNSTSNASTVGAVLVFLVLFILKVNPGGHLDSPVEDWSWWIITLPLWIGLAVLALVALVVVSVALGRTFYKEVSHRRIVKKINASRNVR